MSLKWPALPLGQTRPRVRGPGSATHLLETKQVFQSVDALPGAVQGGLQPAAHAPQPAPDWAGGGLSRTDGLESPQRGRGEGVTKGWRRKEVQAREESQQLGRRWWQLCQRDVCLHEGATATRSGEGAEPPRPRPHQRKGVVREARDQRR